MPLGAWWQVAVRTWNESSRDNVGLVAAGVAFYGFFALVPLLGALVLTYGLLADPATLMEQVEKLTKVLPPDGAKLIGEQLAAVIKTSADKKGFGVAISLGIALFGARNAAGAIISGLNIAYEEEEKRGFITVNLLALLITVSSVLLAVVATFAITSLGYFERLFPFSGPLAAVVSKIGSYLLAGLAGATAAAAIYRYAPSRRKARWVWLTPGSVVFSVLWLLLTFGLGLYAANFGNYNATYGSLASVVVLLTWMYLSAYILLLGAELNAELEHQTEQDSTRGHDRPIGGRGAWVADHVATKPDKPPHA